MGDKLYVRVDGMYCQHCYDTVKRTLSRLGGVDSVALRRNVACLTGESLPSADVIAEAVRRAGYETDESRISPNRRKAAGPSCRYELPLIAAGILLFAWLLNLAFGYNIFNAIPTIDSGLSYGMLFVTGLVTGVHCLSMCGAINLTVVFSSPEDGAARRLFPRMARPLLYNAGRVVSYTVLGTAVGLAGSVFAVNAYFKGCLLITAAAVMLLMGLSLLGLFRFSLPDVFRGRVFRGMHGAFVVGLLGGLMPCGPLQSMQIYALTTGSAARGGLSMLLFALGTVPLMLLPGTVLGLLGKRGRALAGKIGAVLILILSLSMLNRGLLSFGIDPAALLPQRNDGYLAAVCDEETGVQTVRFSLDFDAYADVSVVRGIPVRMIIHADEEKLTGCNSEVVSVDFGFDVPLEPGDNVIEFTPDEAGEYTYACWMNMIRARIRVTDPES